MRFQSSPSLSVGCNVGPENVHASAGSVSILTQPLGWVQPRLAQDGINVRGFQSSPNLSVGCSFVGGVGWCGVGNVSILTQPLGCVQPAAVDWAYAWRKGVSILTQPVVWVQPNPPPNYEGRLFQSSPNLSAECSRLRQIHVILKSWFQSSPNLSVGCSISLIGV